MVVKIEVSSFPLSLRRSAADAGRRSTAAAAAGLEPPFPVQNAGEVVRVLAEEDDHDLLAQLGLDGVGVVS